jgi:DNA-binding Lrp family transcriptional regulator
MLDEFDLALVHALQEAPRAPWTRLSEVLESEPRTLKRHYDHLREAGHVRVTVTTGPRLMERVRWAHLRVRARPSRVYEVADLVASWSQTGSVRVMDGSSDVWALLLGVSHQDLHDQAHALIGSHEAVEALEMNSIIEPLDVGRAGRLDALSADQADRLRRTRGLAPMARTDRSISRLTLEDVGLLGLLMGDGRLDVASCAAALGKDSSTVSRRLSRLQSEGLIDFVTITPDALSSHPVRALLRCEIDVADVPLLVSDVAPLPWIGLLTVTSGRSNLLLMVNVPSLGRITTAQRELRNLCPSLEIRECQLSMRAVKIHTRRLTREGRWTDDVTDPYAQLTSVLVN